MSDKHGDIVGFREQVFEQIIDFSLKERLYFTWLCAVKALPFLSAEKERFSYWASDKKQKHLYAVFNALDIVSININALNDIAYDANAAVRAAYAASRAAANAADTVHAAAYATAYAIGAYDTYGAAYAANVARAAREAVDFGIATAWQINDFENSIFSDIESINLNGITPLDFHIEIYGEVWHNFQDDLIAEGCGYWAEIYDNLFKNGFVVDKEELELRFSVPDSVKAEGAKAVAEYIISAKKQGEIQKVDRETRLILIGSASAGKTTLARRLNGDKSYPMPHDTTHGVDINMELYFNGIKTHLWDFGGQIIYHSSHRCFMSEDCVYILVVNGRDEAAKDLNRIEYWLDTIRVYSKNNAKVFIVVNESDNRKQDIDINSLRQGEYRDLVDEKYYAFNIGEDSEAVNNLKNAIGEYIESRGHQIIGSKDKAAMDELKSMFNQDGTKVIEKSIVDKILENNEIEDDDKERAIKLFNTLGVALSYDCIGDYVLDPTWISRGVYKVVDYMEDKKKKIIYYDSDFQDVFYNMPEYPRHKYNHIYNLMIQHKIGFANKGGLKGLLVPCVASQRRPSDIEVYPEPDNIVTKVTRDGLKEFPADFFERYINENQKDIDSNGDRYSFWQTGMVLVNQNSSAFIEFNEGRVITITVWGENKEQYNDLLYERFDRLLKEYDFIATAKSETDIFGKTETIMDVYHKNGEKGRSLMGMIGDGIKIVKAAKMANSAAEKVGSIAPYAIETAKEVLENIFNRLP